jgi:hypothetical protein
MPGKAAGDLTYTLQALVEVCQSHCDPLYGVALDLRKCFNLLPWVPMHRLLTRLGVPHRPLQMWFSSIRKITRHPIFLGTLGPGMAAANGAPEGDPFSCAIICAVCWLLAHLIEHPTLQARLYVDNWSWTGAEATEVARALHTTQKLTQSLRMSIDWAKTYAWAAGSASQAELKEALLEDAGAPCTIPIVPATVELGVGFVFDAGRHTSQLLPRFQAAHPALVAEGTEGHRQEPSV